MTDQKTKIMAAATDLFLTEGVRVATARIAAAAGVSNGTLFNVFPTKQALIDALYVDAKTSMFAAAAHSGDAPFTRATVRDNWNGYLAWARANPGRRRVMHLLLDAGLASAAAQAQVDALAAPHAVWIQTALDRGIIRGPDVRFLGQLFFFHLDQLIDQRLSADAEDLAFDMLCASIGLTK